MFILGKGMKGKRRGCLYGSLQAASHEPLPIQVPGHGLEIPVVFRYTHLGSVADHRGSYFPDLAHRQARQQDALRPLRRTAFGRPGLNSEVAIQLTDAIATPALLHHLHLWDTTSGPHATKL
eukprot:6237441-Lingulodinium_polyedra.AAC.1